MGRYLVLKNCKPTDRFIQAGAIVDVSDYPQPWGQRLVSLAQQGYLTSDFDEPAGAKAEEREQQDSVAKDEVDVPIGEALGSDAPVEKPKRGKKKVDPQPDADVVAEPSEEVSGTQEDAPATSEPSQEKPFTPTESEGN